MKSCETKVTLASVEKHLTISHPDVFVLFKRILMQKYGLSVKGTIGIISMDFLFSNDDYESTFVHTYTHIVIMMLHSLAPPTSV